MVAEEPCVDQLLQLAERAALCGEAFVREIRQRIWTRESPQVGGHRFFSREARVAREHPILNSRDSSASMSSLISPFVKRNLDFICWSLKESKPKLRRLMPSPIATCFARRAT